jgi:hypothetical protein
LLSLICSSVPNDCVLNRRNHVYRVKTLTRPALHRPGSQGPHSSTHSTHRLSKSGDELPGLREPQRVPVPPSGVKGQTTSNPTTWLPKHALHHGHPRHHPSRPPHPALPATFLTTLLALLAVPDPPEPPCPCPWSSASPTSQKAAAPK